MTDPRRRRGASNPPIETVDPADRISLGEIQAITGCPYSGRLIALGKQGRFPPLRRIGKGQWVWARSEVLAWISAHGRPT